MVVLNVPYDLYHARLNESYMERYGGQGAVSKNQLATLCSITVSSWQMGSLVGAVNALWIADRLGRKCTLTLLAGSFQLVGVIFMILDAVFELFELLIVGRFLSGISGGIVCPILHVFISECSPDKYRGKLAYFHIWSTAIIVPFQVF